MPAAFGSMNPSGEIEDGAPSKVDVLIIGAGPAGAMMANWLARFSSRGITTRIIDRRPTELMHGQADGLTARTLEMFEHIGILQDVTKESAVISEIRFWSPDPSTGRIRRTSVMPQDSPGDSRFSVRILHQNRIEHYLNESTVKNSSGRVAVERGILPESLAIDQSVVEDPSSYPVTVRLRHLTQKAGDGNDNLNEAKSGIYRSSLLTLEQQEALQRQGLEPGHTEVVSAKYVIGCDGAHSWVRRQLGISMIGEQTNYVWGVIEGNPLTNFPDIRTRAAIHSANHGSLMVIPQERGMVRLYIQLPIQVEQGAYLDRSNITPESILDTARTILSPYTLEMKRIEWYTGYPIGQRVTESFSSLNRIFLAGDACHTHSPKAGQGMNVSMQDTYNLGWKMGLVLAGLATPNILHTYADERKKVAHDLIDFDYKFSRQFSAKPAINGEAEDKADRGVSIDEFKSTMAYANRFGAGVLIDYSESILVQKVLSRPELSKNLQVGKRFVSVQVVNITSANPEQLVSNMPADGAFRILVFSGNVAESGAMKRLQNLAAYLDGSGSVISRYTPADQPRDSVIDVLTIHSSPRNDVELYDFPQPSIFFPHHYDKIFCDEPSYNQGDGKAYEKFGIDREEGALIVVRPDNYVGLIVGLDETEKLDRYFANFLIPVANPHISSMVETVSQPQYR